MTQTPKQIEVLGRAKELREEGKAMLRGMEMLEGTARAPRVLPDLAQQDMQAEIAKLKAENAALKSGPVRGLSMKVTDKGGLSIYGMGRFPVTLYRSQWEKLLANSDSIKAFIEANASRLSVKD